MSAETPAEGNCRRPSSEVSRRNSAFLGVSAVTAFTYKFTAEPQRDGEFAPRKDSDATPPTDLLHKTRYLFIFRNSTYEKSGCVAAVLTAFSKAKVRSR
jgi:hypothetical protein